MRQKTPREMEIAVASDGLRTIINMNHRHNAMRERNARIPTALEQINSEVDAGTLPLENIGARAWELLVGPAGPWSALPEPSDG